MALLREDFLTMARLLTKGNGGSELQQRVSQGGAWLKTLSDGTLDEAQLQALTGGNRSRATACIS